MQSSKILSNILVTRPKPAGDALCEKIDAAGYHAILFPTITFLPPAKPKQLQQAIDQLDQLDWLIFISPQAVHASSGAIHQHWSNLPPNLKIAAVGAGTANALQAENFPPALFPEQQWNSEGLLELPEFKQINGQKIGLVCGEDGRDLLAKTLTDRGATVTRLIAYRRALPDTPVAPLLKMLRKNTLTAIVSTSGDGLENLTLLLANEQKKLFAVPLIVISPRMQEQARAKGFKKIFLAKNAGHDAIIETLRELSQFQSQQGLPMENQTESTNGSDNTASTSHPKRSGSGSLGLIISALSVIVFIIAFYLSYNAFQTRDKKIADLSVAMDDKLATNQQLIASLQQSVTETQSNTKALQAALVEQQQALTKMHDNHDATQIKDTLGVDEVQYLATLAQDNLQVGENVALVINLLQTADQKIRDLSNPKLLPIRKALATDIAALQAVPNVDIAGIYLQLAALNQQADKLPLPTMRPEQAVETPENTGKRVSWWKRGLQQSWDTIKKMVVIRYNKSGQIPFITPDQQQYLYQNLHAMFEQAMTAVVHKQPQIYQASLNQAAAWINQYFLTDAPTTQAMLTSITNLQAQNIKPTLPTIDATLQALHEYSAADKSSQTSSQ